MSHRKLSIALTIAGSDSGGGAGIQADLKVFHAHRVHGTSAITGVTAQNTLGVRAIHAVPAEMVRAQFMAVVEDLHPDATKSGMLATAAIVAEVASLLQDHRLPNYVLDPVMVATSGDRLLDKEAETAIAATLLPLATLVTPNLPEAQILSGMAVDEVEGMRAASRALVDQGAHAVLVKGGHLRGEEVVDLFWDGATERIWRRARIPTPHTHGTGCTLSAAVAAGLALGTPLLTAVEGALDLVGRAIASAPGLGSGRGPVNHFERPSPSP